jgi:hypothetical protein
MTRDPADDFDHPELGETDLLRPHVLYRISAADLARFPRSQLAAARPLGPAMLRVAVVGTVTLRRFRS